MGLLAQFFRHKSASHSGTASASEPNSSDGPGEVRGVGAIAAAAGVRTAFGMPAEFELPLGEIIARVPEHCVWPGRHDAGRMLRIPAGDVAPGLERGKPELSIARLAALAPEIFRWERGGTDSPQVRLPIQKLLQQIRSDETSQPPAGTATVHAQPMHSEAVPAVPVPAPQPEPVSAAEISVQPVKLPPPAAPEAMPSVSVVATDRSERARELRPPRDVSISTTLRAMVLGGAATAGSANAQAQGGQILAPRAAPAVPAAHPSVVLSPSVVPSANDAGMPLTPRITPDFAGLQNLFLTGANLDLGGVAALAAALPGVHACVISGRAGSALAGDFSHGVSAGEIREASDDLARIGGAATDMVQRGECDIALFLHGEICVAALVKAGGFVPGVRERLARVAELLAGATNARQQPRLSHANH